MTVCLRCNKRLTFIGQIYCPIEGKEEAFHRMLYIYACLKGNCKDSSEAVRVFRCQLAQSNKYFSERPPNYDLLEMSDAALAESQKDVLDAINEGENSYPVACEIREESKRLSSVYLLDIEDEPASLTKKILKKLRKIEGGEDVDDVDSDEDEGMSQIDKELLEKYGHEEEKLDTEEKAHAKEMLKKYIESEDPNSPDYEKTIKMLQNPDEAKDDDKDDDEDLDEFIDEVNEKKPLTKEFNVFLEATKSCPSQVVRYCQKGMLPLWSGKKYRLKTTNVPRCRSCGSKMTYEAQLMPALYNYVNELVNLNWNSVVLFTCEDSCNPTEAEYIEEFAYVELIDEEERSMDIQDSDTLTQAMGQGKKKVTKSGKPGKGKPKDGPIESTLDAANEAEINDKLKELQLELD